MPMVRAMRLLNAVEAGTLSGTQLETLLTNDPGRLAELNVLMGMRGQARRMAASSTAMTAVTASSLAMGALVEAREGMDAVAASNIAMPLLVASSAAMSAVSASNTASSAISAKTTASMLVLGGSFSVGAYLNRLRIIEGASTDTGLAAQATMTAVAASGSVMPVVAASNSVMTLIAASSTAKMAVFNSDIALNSIKASAIAMAAMRAAASYIVGANQSNGGGAVVITGPNSAGSYIMLGYSKNTTGGQGITTFTTRRSGSSIATNAASITNPASQAGADVDIALPLISPFKSTADNSSIYTWYFGMLRCDV
jgi:hypothetical protein